MKIFHTIVLALVLMIMPNMASAQLVGSQGGTGVKGIQSASIPFGGSSLLRMATSSAFQYSSSLSRLTVTNASTSALTATTATGTTLYGFGLGTCNGAGQAITYSAGLFGCGSITATGDGVSNWLYNGSRLSPSTTVGIGVFASSTISDLSSTYSTSTNFAVTSLKMGSDIITDFTGTNLSIVGGALTAASAAGDGVSNWLFNGSRLTPSTTVGIGVFASSTIGGGTGATGLTINGTATTTALVVPALTSALTLTDGQGLFAEYAGTTCTNQFVRILSALGAATCATVDISADTNLTVDGTEIVLTGDALSLGTALTFTTGTSSTAFQTALLGVGTDYISDITGTGIINTAGALQASLGTSITASEMADGDHGFFTYTTNVASVDASAWTSANLASYLTNETGTGNAVFSADSTLTGLTTLANYTASNGTTTNATSTTGYVSSMFRAVNGIFTTLLDASAAIFRAPYAAAPTIATNGDFGIDSTSGQVKYYDGAVKVLGNGKSYPAFTYATSTAWTGTTTIPLGTAFVAETWNGVQCFTDVGTVNVSFTDGTNRMNAINASTTVGTVTLSTNNTFTAAEKRYVDVGTPASSPTKISCTVSKSLTAD